MTHLRPRTIQAIEKRLSKPGRLTKAERRFLAERMDPSLTLQLWGRIASRLLREFANDLGASRAPTRIPGDGSGSIWTAP